MNYSDSERFSAILEQADIKQVSSAKMADLIVINTCSVRQKAEDRIVGLGEKISAIKATNPNLITVLTGCMARRHWDEKSSNPLQHKTENRWQEKLLKTMPWLDLIIETRNFGQLINILHNEPPIQDDSVDEFISFKPNINKNIHGFVPISYGCNHFCTYCIVPFSRGKEICRDYKSIEAEFKTLLDQGFKDITLLGQTVNRWINPKLTTKYQLKSPAATRISGLNTKIEIEGEEPADFLQLLVKLDKFPGEYWISFVSSHPNYMSREIIDFLAQSKHFRPYFHFALQSGSDKVLARMNRGYTVAEFGAIAKYYKDCIPDATLSTDIIVGFPGETEEDFQATAKIMQELNFDNAFLSEFSPRKGTAAARITDDVPHKEKSRRKAYLNNEILAKTALANNERLVGKTKTALVEKITAKYIFARLDNNKEVRLPITKVGQPKINDFVKVKIISCTPWALTAEIA
jgi:tRNA-2-methylthio-N6-dimethylallyladenosine synthase